MKAFLIRVLLFALLLVAVYGGWSGALLWAEWSAYRQELVMPEGRDIVVIGDSQTEALLDPERFPRLFNFSQSAIAMDQIVLKQKNMLEANPGRIRLFILDLSPYQMFTHDLSQALVDSGPSGSRFLLHCWNFEDNRRPLTGLPTLFRDIVLAKQSKELSRAIRKGRPYRSTLRGGFLPSTLRGFEQFPKKVRKEIGWKTREINEAPLRILDQAFDAAQAFVDRAKAAGIPVLVLTTPYHPAFRADVSPERTELFFGRLETFVKANGCTYLNTYTMPFDDSCWRDSHHLNRKAVPEYTEAVRKTAEALVPAESQP